MRTRSIGVLAAFKCALRTFRGYRGGRSTPYSRMLLRTHKKCLYFRESIKGLARSDTGSRLVLSWANYTYSFS